MKQLVILILFLLILTLSPSAMADTGVVIEAQGEVTISVKGKPIATPRTGSEIPEGATIATGKDGKVTILMANGQMYTLLPHKTLIMTTDAPVKGNVPVIRGIAIALNEATRKDEGEAVHAMVKAPPEEFELTPARKKRLDEDLAKVAAMKLATEDGRLLLKAQVFYKYRQYEDALKLLLELYRIQKPPTHTVTSLINLIYLKVGQPDEAAKYQ